MLSMSDLLITGDIELSSLSKDLAKTGMVVFPSCLILAATWENLTTNDFFSLFKAAVFAFFLSVYGVGIMQSGVEVSFEMSDKLIQNYAKNSVFLSLFSKDTEKGKLALREKAKLSDKDFDNHVPKKTSATSEASISVPSLTWDKLMDSTGQAFSSVYAEILFLLAFFSLWLVGLIYTVVYSLLIVFIPFIASISLFPPLRGAISGLVTSILWCILTPIICTGVLCILEQATKISSNNGIPVLTSLEMMLQFLGLTLMILYVPMLSTAIISGKGVSSVGDSLGNTAAMGALSAGSGLIIAKTINTAWAAHDIASKGLGTAKSIATSTSPISDRAKHNTVAKLFGQSVKGISKGDVAASLGQGAMASPLERSVRSSELNEMMRSSSIKKPSSQTGSRAYKDFSNLPGYNYGGATAQHRNYKDLSNEWEDRVSSIKKNSSQRIRAQNLAQSVKGVSFNNSTRGSHGGEMRRPQNYLDNNHNRSSLPRRNYSQEVAHQSEGYSNKLRTNRPPTQIKGIANVKNRNWS